MDAQHNMLLRDIFDSGGIPMCNAVESRRLLDELVQAGLVEITCPEGMLPDGHAPLPEYQLTAQGKAIVESHPRQ